MKYLLTLGTALLCLSSLNACRIEVDEDGDDDEEEIASRETNTRRPTNKAECDADSDCGVDEICSRLGSCILPDCDQIGTEPTCERRTDCAALYTADSEFVRCEAF